MQLMRGMVLVEIIPESAVLEVVRARNNPNPVLRGKVVKVGPGLKLASGEELEPQVKPGDIVLFPAWSGTEIKRGDNFRARLLPERDIMAVIC